MASRQLRAVLAAAAVLLAATACASPGAGEETSGPATASVSSEAPSSTPGSETQASDQATPTGTQTAPQPSDPAASSAPTGGPAPQPGAEPWPPKLVFSDILEAGTTTVQLGKVTITLPSGFGSDGSGGYTSTWAGAAGPASITITEHPATQDAAAELAASASWARNATVEVPGASSAAVADAVVGGVQTWGLAVVDSGGTATIVTYSAAPQDFENYLIYQSLCSVKVAA